VCEFETKKMLSREETGPNWHVKEIRGCEDLLQVQRLVLGGAKRVINVATTSNKEAIVLERRCNITFDDFPNVHVVVVKKVLEVAQ